MLSALIIGALIIGARASDSSEPTPEQRARSIADRVKCPTCRSQSVADSKAGLSGAIYEEILRRVESGQSDGQVLEYIRVTYGDDELLVPPATGAGSIVWVLPVVVVIAAGAALAIGFRRWRPGRAVATDADRALVARELRRDAEAAVSAADAADRSGGDVSVDGAPEVEHHGRHHG